MNLAARLQALQPADIGVPGPSSADMARAFRSVRRDPLTFLTEVTERFGDTVAFPVPGAPAVLLNDPAHVRQVLQTSARNWGKQTVQYAALARVTGPGLLACAEPNWIEHRRLAAPAFHRRRLEAVGEQVRDAARTVLADQTPPAHSGSVVDVSQLMHRIGLDAVGRALFCSDLTASTERLLDASSGAAEFIVRLGRSVLPTAQWAPTRTNLRLRSVRRKLDAVATDIIAARRRTAAPSTPDFHGDDLLGLLIDSELTDVEIRDELITMVIAGHETVAAALSWTLMLLAEHTEIQDRMRAELGALGSPVSMLTPREQLPITRAAIDEALRLYPPAWAISRRSLAAERVGDVDLPAGTLAIISPWLLHRRGESWPEPTQFRPERFIQGVPTSGYIPFGQGPRLCIGRDFALGEMLVVIGELLSSYRLDTPPGWTRPEPETLVAVHPRGGMPLRLTPADHHA